MNHFQKLHFKWADLLTFVKYRSESFLCSLHIDGRLTKARITSTLLKMYDRHILYVLIDLLKMYEIRSVLPWVHIQQNQNELQTTLSPSTSISAGGRGSNYFLVYLLLTQLGSSSPTLLLQDEKILCILLLHLRCVGIHWRKLFYHFTLWCEALFELFD